MTIDKRFPLIDLHRHIEGSVRPESILDLGRQHNLTLPAWDVEALRPHIQVTSPQPGVMAFLEKFTWAMQVLVDYDACRRIAYESVEDAQGEGITYIELRFSPWFMAEIHGLDPAGVTEAVVDGVKAAGRDTGLQTNLIGILSRTYGIRTAWKELSALLSQREHIIALDLAGDEANFPGDLFEEHIRVARAAGWHITIHAGESAGPESIWQAVQKLGAERIGHAASLDQDPTLVEYMIERGIGIESNLTSNVQTSTVSEYTSHPLKGWLERGLLATINSDDPAISGIDLPYEYNIAGPKAGLTQAHLRQAQRNALAVAFLSDKEKLRLQAGGKVV